MWAMRGLTAAEITHQTKLPRSTVKYHLKRFKETGSWSRREYPMRVKTLTPFAECIRKHLKLHPHASATELHELLSTKYQLMVSVRTVQRFLKSAGREPRPRDDNLDEDSDTSTTEELSAGSPPDHALAGPSERSSSPRSSSPTTIESHTQIERRGSATSVVHSNSPLVPSALGHPLRAPGPLPSMSVTPPLFSIPFTFTPPYAAVMPHTMAWQECRSLPSASTANLSAYPLLPSSLPSFPLGYYPMYTSFGAPVSPDTTIRTQTTAPLPSAPTRHSQTVAPNAAASPTSPSPSEPRLQALVNAALISEFSSTASAIRH